MKKSNGKMKTMDANEAGKIVGKAQKEEGENWADYWNPMDEDLLFIGGCLDVLIGYCETIDEGDSMMAVMDELGKRVERVKENLRKVVHRLREKHRLGPHMPKSDDNWIFTLPKVTVEKYRLT